VLGDGAWADTVGTSVMAERKTMELSKVERAKGRFTTLSPNLARNGRAEKCTPARLSQVASEHSSQRADH